MEELRETCKFYAEDLEAAYNNGELYDYYLSKIALDEVLLSILTQSIVWCSVIREEIKHIMKY